MAAKAWAANEKQIYPLCLPTSSMAAWSEKPNKENAFQRPIDWYNERYAFSKIINKSKVAKNNPIKLPLLTFSNQSAFITDNIPNIIANILKNLGHFSSNPTTNKHIDTKPFLKLTNILKLQYMYCILIFILALLMLRRHIQSLLTYENTEIELEFVPRSGQKNGNARFWCVVCDVASAEDHQKSVTW
ncbi:hypothetical protein Tsp_11507 [Trichinella spiralis]|uniref:hypothetical protein n=1 Tax=Trichinella spiralis TaxID=6334 RepID=UPI0001EFE161|nr:hypothetical protein Tsp_11507 [Trichinella spiralis]